MIPGIGGQKSKLFGGVRSRDPRIWLVQGIIAIAVLAIVSRIFFLMIIQHDFYVQLANGSHELFERLIPKRGAVYAQDTRNKELYPLAMNRDVFLLYANTQEITNDNMAETVAETLAEVFSYDDEKKLAIYYQLNKRTDPYEPLEKHIEEGVKKHLEAKELPGIHFVRQSVRFYPEQSLAAQTIGFLGKDSEGEHIGRYGVEGYWNAELAGTSGFVEGLRGARGGLILSGGKKFEPATDGVDIYTTIDRTLQFKACSILEEARKEYEATSASLVIMDPKSGAIYAMCSTPEFNPNTYGHVEEVRVYNNTTIFTPYEPGSIFKPITMAAAINEGRLTPASIYHDRGVVDDVCETKIRNADQKIYKDQTMTGVLENSVNTGMVYVSQQLGKDAFKRYIHDFGFAAKTGIGLDSEVSGVVSSLDKNKGDKIDCYAATASFGQGITTTPLQMVNAFSVIANGGVLMKPFVVERIEHSDGRVERTKPKEIRRVLSQSTASLVSAMLVSVIDSGHATGAGVNGYYIGGKTGTAQIAGRGGYTAETNHSFVGFGPVDDPKFAMIVKFEKPQRRFSASTAAPTFGKVARFIMNYYAIPPAR
ncbi:MAG: penicillin-binding protein 2 [Candidatus Magasanikbacteria bacterium]|jgi:stage V sporulation protein D (sporulation-specific penicillin-binding protein)|nr:penicillin-binding protein 2 [Candidatus Magasanikbacteria bacterium]MBT5820292.1 penicillin-binding protein 2 [Candidatus Magasanikbacteria bacterium]MBT6294870.1 penicillin-binding protein 2 [Candidatus Magasanikbacteria bacterium]